MKFCMKAAKSPRLRLISKIFLQRFPSGILYEPNTGENLQTVIHEQLFMPELVRLRDAPTSATTAPETMAHGQTGRSVLVRLAEDESRRRSGGWKRRADEHPVGPVAYGDEGWRSPAVHEPINALMRLAENSRFPDGRLGVPILTTLKIGKTF